MNNAILPLIIAAAGSFDYCFHRHPLLRVESINWQWRNQRQVRKNRRRAFANGNRRAFD